MQVHEMGDLREDQATGERNNIKEEEMEEGVSKLERSRDSNDPLDQVLVDNIGDEDEDDDSIFYGDFPSLPDFTCISSSSSSSSSSSALPTRSTSSSSASSAWAVLKAEYEEVGDMLEEYNGDASVAPPADGVPPPATADGMDVLDEIADMGILDDTDIWDPTALFPDEDENNINNGTTYNERPEGDAGNYPNNFYPVCSEDRVPVRGEEEEEEDQKPSEDLAMVFFEWLKTNKESISPEDLRSIRLKRSTIECAARRLGGGKEGMKQLLKLILAWVQDHHLQKRRNNYHAEENNNITAANGQYYYNQNHPSGRHNTPQAPYPLPVNPPPVEPCFSPPWMAPPPYLADPAPGAPGGYPAHVNNMQGTTTGGYNSMGAPPSSDYAYMNIDPNAAWSTAQFPQYGATDPAAAAQPYVGFSNSYAGPAGTMIPGAERFAKMASSATKEARKKRMARQRRLFTHHHHHHHHHHHGRHQNHHASRLVSTDGACTANTAAVQNNWVLYPPSSAPAGFGAQPMMSPADGVVAGPHADSTVVAMQPRQMGSDRRQGWKSEKNLRFLLQKVLKQSDVGNLGRIVLPKKEAETHLPELDARDGISIQMEDIGTSRVWNMRYRYWPNNKSRMYLLENTGDFVRSNGLQEGDFIVIYSDAKCSKYMIRGVKVRKPELKPETKSPVKAAKTSNLTGSTTTTGTAEGVSPTSQQTSI